MVVAKPPTLLSVPDRYDPERPNLQNDLRELYGEAFVVHRLDADTSGVMVFARHAEAHRHLSLQFQERSVVKDYIAYVRGRPPVESGKVDVPIGPAGSGRMQTRADGKPAVTWFREDGRWNTITRLALRPETGRTHQIRVHCRYMGCPLLVDAFYGMDDAFYLSSIVKRYRTRPGQEERPLVARATLHARALTIAHPRTGEERRFEAGLPKDLAALQKQLDKNL